MANLSRVLLFKIVVTFVFWFIPLLFFSTNYLHESFGFPDIKSMSIFIKLLGMAYGSLLICYAWGLTEVRQGRYPSITVWVGIASNGGAFIVLTIAAISQAWKDWGLIASGFMWASLCITALITGGLLLYGTLDRNRMH